jgi:hypothetical protein
MATDPSKINSQINLGIPDTPPDGLKSGEVKELYAFTINAMNNILRNLEQFVGITTKDITQWSQLTPQDTLLRHEAGRLYVIAGENLSFGSFVGLVNNAGVLNVKKAFSTNPNPLPAVGYCNIPGGAIAGQITEIILSQGILSVTGLNPGQPIYLSGTPGVPSTTPDTTVFHIEQFLGIGIATNLAYIDISLGEYVQH